MKHLIYLLLTLQCSISYGQQCSGLFTVLSKSSTPEKIRPYAGLKILTYGSRRGQTQLNIFYPAERIRFFSRLEEDPVRYKNTPRPEGKTRLILPGQFKIFEKQIRHHQNNLFQTYLKRGIVSQRDVDQMKTEPIDLNSKHSTWRFLDREDKETVASSQTIWEWGQPLPLEQKQNIIDGLKIEIRRLFSDPDILDTVFWAGKMADQDLYLGAVESSGGNLDLAEKYWKEATVVATAVRTGSILYARYYGMTIVDPLSPQTFPPSVQVETFQRLAETYASQNPPKFIVWAKGEKFWSVFHNSIYPRNRN